MNQAAQAPWTKQDLLEVAKCQKNILWMIIVGLGAMGISMYFPYVNIFVGFVQIYFFYKLAIAVRSSVPWVYVILAFIPFINLISLLYLNGEATKALRTNGINVSLMGARMTDFDLIQ